MGPFAGFAMPILYTSIVAEHRAVRSRAGLFDVSHMGELRIRGRDAIRLAQRIFTNDLMDTAQGRVRYGFLCLEDGGVVDDVTLYRTTPEEVLLCVNAANTREDLEWILAVRRREGLDCEVVDESAETALLALQGPGAASLLAPQLPERTPLPRPWHSLAAEVSGVPALLSRTGYTGEDGFEIFVRAEGAEALWRKLLAPGTDRVVPAGLGARDTLRTEMAYPLYGHELDRSRTPVEAGLQRFCAFGAGFIGEEALAELLRRGPTTRRVGLLLEGRAVARPGYSILNEGPVGTVTSGTFGPSVERSVAIGYVPAAYARVGTRLAVAIRERRVPCEVVTTPFYRRKG
jgi:aminomethyltransferase